MEETGGGAQVGFARLSRYVDGGGRTTGGGRPASFAPTWVPNRLGAGPGVRGRVGDLCSG